MASDEKLDFDSNDLVERLKRNSWALSYGPTGLCSTPTGARLISELTGEAAKEIQSLRSQLANMKNRADGFEQSKWEYHAAWKKAEEKLRAGGWREVELRELLGGFVLNRAHIKAGDLQPVLDKLMDLSAAALRKEPT